MYKKKLALALIPLFVLAGSVLFSPPAGAVGATDDQKNAEVVAYQVAHPDDYAGLDRLVRKYTGQGIVVSFSDSTKSFNGVQAQAHVDNAKRAGSSGGVSTAAYPNFTVAITGILQLGFPMHYRYTGSWNLPDSFAGQRVPDDFGTLTFLMPNCMLMSGYGVATYTYNGISTNRGYLKAANGHAPIFGVRDYTTNFMSQADHGLMAVTVTNNCTSAQQVTADFIYEGNAGGGVVGVTAGWGFLSVTYTGGPIAAQRGTAPIYRTF